MKIQNDFTKKLAIGAGAILLVGMMSGNLFAQGGAKDIYAQRCASCHGATGKGDGPAGKVLKPKPSDFAVSLKGKNDDWIAKAIKDGGPAVGESAIMPGYGDLSDQQIKELVEYIKKFNA